MPMMNVNSLLVMVVVDMAVVDMEDIVQIDAWDQLYMQSNVSTSVMATSVGVGEVAATEEVVATEVVV